MADLRGQPLRPVVVGGLLLATVGMLWNEQIPGPARPAYVVVYLLLAPGYAFLPELGREHRLLHFLLALSVGLTLAIGLSTAMSEAGFWHVEAAVGLTMTLVMGAVAVRLWRDRAAFAASLHRGTP